MKHILFIAIVFSLSTAVAHAQHVNLGVKGGLNSYTILGDNNNVYEPIFSYHAGLLGHIHFNTRFAFQPEVVFSVQGNTHKIGGIDNQIKLNYVNVPLILQYMYDNGFRIEAGPQLGILTSAKSTMGTIVTDSKANYESTDFGVTVGMSYVKPSTGFGVDIRYNYGLTNINTINTTNFYNRGMQLGLFFLFQHKS